MLAVVEWHFLDRELTRMRAGLMLVLVLVLDFLRPGHLLSFLRDLPVPVTPSALAFFLVPLRVIASRCENLPGHHPVHCTLLCFPSRLRVFA